MLSKLQEFVDNMKRFLDQKTTSSIAAPAPTETAPPPPRTAVPNISAVEDNSRIEAGPTKKGAMAAALAMTLQRLNNVQAANDATARDVAIRQSDREAAAEAHRIESAARLADEKNLLNFKETLPSNVDARATNKAYREAMTRNANLGADLKQARLSGTMPTGRGGSRSAAPTSDNVVLDDAAYQELANSGVDIKNLSDKDLKRIYFAMNRKSATGAAPKDVDKEAAIREKIVRIQSNIERRKEFNPAAGPTEDEAALLGHYKSQLGAAPPSAAPVKGNSVDDQTAAFLAKKQQQAAPVQTVAPTAPAATNNIVEFKGDDGRTYKIDKTTGKIYVK